MTLEAPNIPTDNEIEAARLWLRARARFLVGGLKGRGKLDPIYVATTEGRDGPGPEQRKRYSSCGDLPQALCFELGCRQDFVNRAEHKGWRPGRNLLDFYAGKDAPAVPSNEVPGCGAICFVWSDSGMDAHTFVAGHVLTNAPEVLIETFNFGAGGMSPAEFPGAHQSNARLREAWSVVLKSGVASTVLVPLGQARTLGAGEKSQRKLTGLWVGNRRLRYVLEVPRLLGLCDPDLLPVMSGEVIDAIEAEIKA